MSKIISMHAIWFPRLPAEENDEIIGQSLMMSDLGTVKENLEHLCII